MDKSTANAEKMYHREICKKKRPGAHAKPPAQQFYHPPPFFQGSTPRLLMHLPVSYGLKIGER